MARRAPLAQLDRASGYEPGGRRFESCRARQPGGWFWDDKRWGSVHLHFVLGTDCANFLYWGCHTGSGRGSVLKEVSDGLSIVS